MKKGHILMNEGRYKQLCALAESGSRELTEEELQFIELYAQAKAAEVLSDPRVTDIVKNA
jgi:hypothetical protein